MQAVHLMVAALKEVGLDHPKVHEALYDNFLEKQTALSRSYSYQYRLELFYELNTALIFISKDGILNSRSRPAIRKGLVNYPLSIQGIKLVGCVIDRDEERKWSFRSKGNFDCNTFARKYFNGGGHFNASAAMIQLSSGYDKKFKKAIKENSSLLQ